MTFNFLTKLFVFIKVTMTVSWMSGKFYSPIFKANVATTGKWNRNRHRGDILLLIIKFYTLKSMTAIDIHGEFVKMLENKIPKKTRLADLISDLLRIEKESAYRRLRGDVQFTFREAALIARQLNVSLDETVLYASPESRTKNVLEMPVLHSDVTGMSEKAGDLLIEMAILFLKELSKQPFSEFGLAISGIPFSLFLNYSCLSRLYIMKYLHNGNQSKTYIPFGKVFESRGLIEEREEFYLLFRQISNTFYIWDRKIIPSLVDDIQYFRSIRLITDNDIRELKEEIHRFLNDLEQLAVDGKFRETGNNFNLFISDLTIDVTYAYLWSEEVYTALFTAFIFFATASQEEGLVNRIILWVRSMRRRSTLISGNAAKERIVFFDRQRAIIDTL
jgi:hypothetical protein